MATTERPTPAGPAASRTPRHNLLAGVWAVAPLNLGVAAFGLAFGAAARDAGLTTLQVVLMSLLVFSGAAQTTGVSMLAAGAHPLAIVLTTLALGLRHVLMGATLAPYLRRLGRGWRLLLAFQMVDESYAVTISRFRAGHGDHWFFLGANLALYVVWALATLAGALLGELVPDPAAWGFDLVFPLIFLALLVSLIQSRRETVVAVIAGVLALAGSQLLPGHWYLIGAALVASGLGLFLDRAPTKIRRAS